MTLSAADGDLVVLLAHGNTWVLSDQSTVGPTQAASLGRDLAARLPSDAELLISDARDGDARDVAARAAGFTPYARKLLVEKVFSDADKSALPTGWRLESLAQLGRDGFAQRMLAAAHGDPFNPSTPDTAAADLQDLVDYAGEAFDPDAWYAVSDDEGPLGVVLPQLFTGDEHDLGTLFYIGIVPERRGAGLGRQLHRWGLGELARRGARRYVGSTDDRNGAMAAIFAANGASVEHVQTFYRRG